jgi:hypothetical protein
LSQVFRELAMKFIFYWTEIYSNNTDVGKPFGILKGRWKDKINVVLLKMGYECGWWM